MGTRTHPLACLLKVAFVAVITKHYATHWLQINNPITAIMRFSEMEPELYKQTIINKNIHGESMYYYQTRLLILYF